MKILAVFLTINILSIIIAIPIIVFYKKKNKNKVIITTPENAKISNTSTSENKYYKRKFLTEKEKEFLRILNNLFSNKYIIQPQVPLRMLIKKENEDIFNTYANELNRYIDFGIFNKDYEILALVELNDVTHKEYERHQRDIKVKNICEQAQIPLITFWTYGKQTNEDIKYIIEKEIENAKQTNQFIK